MEAFFFAGLLNMCLYLNVKQYSIPHTMKKALFAALSLLILMSCKKDYVCDCTTTSPAGITSITENTGKMKKRDAIARCNEGDETFNNGQFAVATECEISGGSK